MDIPNFKDQPEFAESAIAADKTAILDMQEPNKFHLGICDLY